MKFDNYVSNLRVRTKLILFLIFPVLALSFFVTTGTYTKWLEYQNANNANNTIDFSLRLVALVHELQKERGLTIGFIESGGQNFRDDMEKQRRLTDDKSDQFFNFMQTHLQQNSSWATFEGLKRFQEELQQLPKVRTTIDLAENTNGFFDYYSELNALALGSIRTMDMKVNVTPIAKQVRLTQLYTILLWLQERSGQERAALNKTINSKEFTLEQSQKIRSFAVIQESLLKEYSSIASEAQLELIQQKLGNTVFADVEHIRKDIVTRIKKVDLLDKLQILVGQGNQIHNFRNYAIQDQGKYSEHFNGIRAEAKLIIREYHSLAEMGEVEIDHLNAIETVLEEYNSFYNTVLELKRNGGSMEEIIRIASVDDTPASSAFTYLRKSIVNMNAHQSWTKTTARINLIMEVSDDIRVEMARHASKINKDAGNSLGLYLLITFVTIASVVILGYLLMRRLVGDLFSIATSMRNMRATGNLDRLQEISGDDEIGDMATAFNDLVVERNRMTDELQKLSRAVESSSSAVITTDPDGNIEYTNPKFSEITGYTKEEALGQNPRILKSGEVPDSVYADLWKTILAGREWKGEFHNRRKDGSLYWAHNSVSGVRDTLGNTTHFVAIQEDVTQRHKLTEQLSHQASHDALTGLVNRCEFERRTERLLSTIRQDKDEHALCYIDLDQFKIVNDTCGHTAGDELLRQISIVLQRTSRKRDTLARLGGDEFGLLMEHCSLKHAQRVAVSIQKAIQDYQFAWEGQSFRVGASMGLVTIDGSISDLVELMKQADAACYMAKDKGRNRIHVHQAEDSELAQRHGEMQWVARIHLALEENRFCLYAQSIVSLNEFHDTHYELLLRMVDEEGQIIPPGAFLPAAERYDLIDKLDRWVIENTFRSLAANPTFLQQIQFVSINLSGQSMADESFHAFVVDQFEANAILPGKICFEITETAAISNLSNATKFISTLRDLGCSFALDDFGSGLSSFAYLKNLPVDYLKIDGMFVKDIVDDPIDRAMVKSISEIGQVMGMKTIAEFVENDVIMGMLKEIGVDYAQGYGIDRPRSFDELLERSNNVTDIKRRINY